MTPEQEKKIREKYTELVTLPLIIKYFDKQYKGKPIVIASLKDYIK